MKLTIVLLLGLIHSSVEASEFITEASGVCRVGQSLLIAGDEEPKTIWSIKDEQVTKIKVKGGTWDDLEDLSTVDDKRFFAVTSHSRTKKGKRKPEREQLMLLSKKGESLKLEAKWSLREQILELLKMSLSKDIDIKTVEVASPDEGGLNIEGLAYTGSKLYFGLRSPLTKKGEAIILVAKNTKEVLEGATPVLSEVIRVSLKKNGIRGLTLDGQGLLILSGPTNDAEGDFDLNWFNLSHRNLNSYSLPGFSSLLRPEGLVKENDGSVTLVQDFEGPQTQDVVVNF